MSATPYYCTHGHHALSPAQCQKCADDLVSLGIQADKDRIAALENEVSALRRQLSEAHMAAGRASVIAYKEARNGIERHPGNTAHENAAWEWGRKDGGWS